jgi:hypothetical protein
VRWCGEAAVAPPRWVGAKGGVDIGKQRRRRSHRGSGAVSGARKKTDGSSGLQRVRR